MRDAPQSSFEAMGEIISILRQRGHGVERAQTHELKIGYFVWGETDQGQSFQARTSVHDDLYQLPAIVQIEGDSL